MRRIKRCMSLQSFKVVYHCIFNSVINYSLIFIILYITTFIVKNKHKFTGNSEVHNIYTRQHSNFHQPAPNLTGFRYVIYYSGVKIYEILPLHIKQLSGNPTLFEQKLKNFLHLHSFYSFQEYFQIISIFQA
jgi:hypothetical protein